MKTYFSFADEKFQSWQRMTAETALKVGKFDNVLCFGPQDIDVSFVSKNAEILSCPIGAGLWLWKFYFVDELLNGKKFKSIPEDSWIFYCDADTSLVAPVDCLIACAERDGQSMMFFRGCTRADLFCHPDIFIITGANEPKYKESSEGAAGYFLFKKNDVSREFFAEVLRFACMPGVLAGTTNLQPANPLPLNFFRHNWDEPLLNIIRKKHDLYGYRHALFSEREWNETIDFQLKNGWPMWGTKKEHHIVNEFPLIVPGKSTYPKIIHHC